MKATLHYDNNNTAPVNAVLSQKKLHYIEFSHNGEIYIMGKNKLAQNGIIRVTDTNEKTLWSLNPKVNYKETP